MGQYLFLADDESMKMMILKSNKERLSYIESVQCNETKRNLREQYEMMWGCGCADSIRNYFSFLKCMTIEETLQLYDTLTNQLRLDMIHAIKNDHFHLKCVIEVHKFLSNATVVME